MQLRNRKLILWTKFWRKFEKKKELLQEPIVYFLHKYGTTLYENRGVAGLCIEKFLCKYLENIGVPVKGLSQQRKIDIDLPSFGSLSVKYAKTNVILHNSRGINSDMNMVDTIIFTSDHVYLIIPEMLHEYEIPIENYIKNYGDNLTLKKSFFKALQKTEYPFMTVLDLNIPESQNISISDLIFEEIKEKVEWLGNAPV